ncbi:cell division protein FtsW [bacterium]|nr:cell division protein FtsW [bacterium]
MSYQRLSKIESSKYILSPFDKNLLIIVIFLIVVGVISTFSAMVPKEIREGINPIGIILKQLMFIGIGTFGMLFFSKKSYKQLLQYAVPFAWFVVILLVFVKFTPLGVTVNGAKRWLGYGFLQFQPSELAKPAISMLLACAFCKDANLLDPIKWKRYFFPIICMLGLIFLQPNLSMVMLLLATGSVLYLCAGGSKLLIFGSVILAFVIGPFLMHDYQSSRVAIWKNPDIDPRGAGFNIIQSTIAFVGGGLFGEGFGNSKQKLGWLPEGHTDFIFAIYAEEFGFIGCVLLIILFIMFIHRGLLIASKSNDIQGKILALGLTASIGIQAFLNMSVASAMIPATGVTLPFISYGGTSLVISMCMIGILLNISKKRITRIQVYGQQNY